MNRATARKLCAETGARYNYDAAARKHVITRADGAQFVFGNDGLMLMNAADMRRKLLEKTT